MQGEAEGEEKGREEKEEEVEEEERAREASELSPKLEGEVGSLKKMLANVAEQTGEGLCFPFCECVCVCVHARVHERECDVCLWVSRFSGLSLSVCALKRVLLRSSMTTFPNIATFDEHVSERCNI